MQSTQLDLSKLPNEAIIRLPAVVAMVGRSRTCIYQDIAAGLFPKQVSLGARSVGWRLSDVKDWIAQRSPTSI